MASPVCITFDTETPSFSYITLQKIHPLRRALTRSAPRRPMRSLQVWLYVARTLRGFAALFSRGKLCRWSRLSLGTCWDP
jgi:hypothetical protein